LSKERETEGKREREREREKQKERNKTVERDKYISEGETRRDYARVVKVDYILLSHSATCCTLGRTGLPGKSNHR